ncbi:MAG: TIGR00282 family metallophosphoesterase [Oscillospiraceae bacterium]|jgi:metallophosphoesterase (TIGR00282 family)|nr:TIGR00282 family metallophosphoesterase [Oscillospiraceae bacterium]
MRLLFVGDVVGYIGCAFLWDNLKQIKRDHKVDIIAVNGENSAVGNGITKKSAEHIFNSGADVITTGNHAFKRKECNEVFTMPNILRPINFPEGVQGRGVTVLDLGKVQIAVINLMGISFMEPIDNPFFKIDEVLKTIETPNIFVDFHAEATAEKKSMGYYLAERVTALVGTHTHVQTNDSQILCGHTGYITDIGMTGSEESVIGVEIELAISRQKYHTPVQFKEATEKPFLNAVLIEFDEKTGICTKIQKIIKRN